MNKIDLHFCKWESETPDAPFLKQPFGDRWETYSWSEAGVMARRLASGLKAMGLRQGAHVGIISKNCREWVIADLAITFAGMVSVPLYPTLKAEGIAEVIELGDLDATFLGKIEDWEGMKAGIPDSLPCIRFPHYEGNGKVDKGEDWFEFIEKHEALSGNPSFDPDETWTIIFTSGTTGTPKGVVLHYGGLESTRQVVEENNVVNMSLTGDNKFFSFLPLNHIAERILVEQSCMKYGGSIAFAESLDRFVINLQQAQPTFFFAVPRIWTKFQLGVLAKMPQKKLDLYLKIPILSGIVKKKIKEGLGMTHVRGTITGAAAIPQALKDWYRKLGVPMVEGYGMTENFALCTSLEGHVNLPGSVGQALPGATLKIDPDTGEIMMQAGYMMKGYYKDPQKTAEVIDNGWLRTGDQGKLDSAGNLFITGRVKDTFKTEKGQFIVPSPIESKIEPDHNIEQLCVLGLGCPQPLVVVVLSEIGEAKSKEALTSHLTDLLGEVNASLPNYQKLSTMVIAKEAWDVDNNLLTPTLKVKRSEVHNHYSDKLASWSSDSRQIVFE